MAVYRTVPATLLVLLMLFVCAGRSAAQPAIEDNLWLETAKAIESGNQAESLRLLRLCVSAQLNLPESAKQLRQALTSEASKITSGKSVDDLTAVQLTEFHKLQREICGLTVADAGDWLLLLKACMLMPGSGNLVFSGLAFLDAVKLGMPVGINEEWLKILNRLDAELVRDEQILYRLQIAQIFSGLQPESQELKRKLADLKLLADAKAVKILRLAEVEMAIGNLTAARACLDQVRRFDYRYSGLEDLYRKLNIAEQIDKIIIQANDDLMSKKYEDARRRAEEILKLDANNFFARGIIERIEEERKRPDSAAVSDADRLQLKLRRLEAELRKAETEQDLQEVSTCLRRILALNSYMPEHAHRLSEVEQEIAFSRMKSDERFAEAEDLFRKGEYVKLRLFLNRNPGLMNSLERMLQIWEMRLMANFATARLEPAQLRAAATDINRRAGRSFYASYVLMRLDIADNKLNDAREHYKVAQELKPDNVLLRWPSMLLWVHGPGRPFAVILLIIAFLLLIKMIGPFFRWFESTYWWRVALLSKVFPSLAVRSLEGCFGEVRERADRIILFTLLMESCYRVGDKKRALLYADNLIELVPLNAAALEMRSKIKNPAASESAETPPAAASGHQITSLEGQPSVPPVDPSEQAALSAADEQHYEAEQGCEEPLDNDYEPDETFQSASAEPVAQYLSDETPAAKGAGAMVNREDGAISAEPGTADTAKPLTPVAAEYSWPPPVVDNDDEDGGRPKGDVGEVMVGLFNDFFSEKKAEPLPNNHAESKIDEKRRELFASLDALQSPAAASEAWLKCDGSKARARLFRELDQGR
ncbi:MAG: hypothetical protein CVV41_15835 [Candidatus Riflebacteria bacterium HGW-Riflebacteria-1]|nr:MAG: hypothetical protein CVV41_15835 [Candidatus Riflebacteria bacterium HGW-Riflebacteria-1]